VTLAPGVIQDNANHAFSGISSSTIFNFTTAAAPYFYISDDTDDRPEGNTSTTPFTFNVTRFGDPVAATVHWAVQFSGGTNAADFSGPLSGDLTFAAGDTATQTIQVNVVGDTTYESPEQLLLQLSNPVGATFGLYSG